ncbi:STAS/SEC14 domain-containing protein [Fundidesulfovibrio agrisoli]|uniref:STAS/SEC14 domain-containing protein n=1 Tax=Fundidesulfovibrio agrisoli TaxID=2922717 RepID=UPI001FAC04B9|nr:STAS/SEC14 domain-containing protein [Fundidesulfovibrio agrisoli]
MFKPIPGLPPDVLAIEAIGKVTHQDYQEALIPAAEALMAKGPIRVLFVAGPDFTGYDLEALWDDAAFGSKHWRDFSRMAIVADVGWMRAAVSMFKPFFRGEVGLFRVSELDEAKGWIVARE